MCVLLFVCACVACVCVCGEGRGATNVFETLSIGLVDSKCQAESKKINSTVCFSNFKSDIPEMLWKFAGASCTTRGKDEPLLSQALQVLASYLQTRATQVASFPGIPHFLCSLACIDNNKWKWKGGEKLETRLLQKNKKRDQAESISAAISLFCSTLHVCVILLMSHGSKLACSSSSRDEM